MDGAWGRTIIIMSGGSHPEHNVVLTGFMGSGKSSVGRALAAAMRRRFIDTDEVISERHGPIPSIFAEHGEAVFRAHERSLARELAGEAELVISTGGGMLVDPTVADELSAAGRIFCLTATPATIVARAVADGLSARPLLDGDDPEGRVAALLAERSEVYARFEAVPTDHRSVEEIVDDLLRRLAD